MQGRGATVAAIDAISAWSPTWRSRARSGGRAPAWSIVGARSGKRAGGEPAAGVAAVPEGRPSGASGGGAADECPPSWPGGTRSSERARHRRAAGVAAAPGARPGGASGGRAADGCPHGRSPPCGAANGLATGPHRPANFVYECRQCENSGCGRADGTGCKREPVSVTGGRARWVKNLGAGGRSRAAARLQLAACGCPRQDVRIHLAASRLSPPSVSIEPAPSRRWRG